MSRLALRTLAPAVAATLTIAACNPFTAATPATPGLSGDNSAIALANLRVAPDATVAGYSRAEFGDGWVTQPDGCNTRIDVLLAEGTDITRHGCTITAGRWLSLYDGVLVTSPHDLDIDHIVPLANAWVTGAAAWTTHQREAFANDVHRELVAVSAHSNRSKGDEAPPNYEPPNTTEDCAYAQRWIAVKAAYHLTVTTTEHQALTNMLNTCKP